MQRQVAFVAGQMVIDAMRPLIRIGIGQLPNSSDRVSFRPEEFLRPRDSFFFFSDGQAFLPQAYVAPRERSRAQTTASSG